MSFLSLVLRRLISVTILLAVVANVPSQTPKQDRDSDVVRIDTELVQTGVMVFDKEGRFVDGLTPEQFELRIDGKPVKLSFFDRVKAGTRSEEKQIAAAMQPDATKTPVNEPTTMGRRIIFSSTIYTSRSTVWAVLGKR